MVDFGSERGLSVFETTDIVRYFEDFKKAKTKRWGKRCHLWMGTEDPAKKGENPSPLHPAG
jgi:hypothetical protein